MTRSAESCHRHEVGSGTPLRGAGPSDVCPAVVPLSALNDHRYPLATLRVGIGLAAHQVDCGSAADWHRQEPLSPRWARSSTSVRRCLQVCSTCPRRRPSVGRRGGGGRLVPRSICLTSSARSPKSSRRPSPTLGWTRGPFRISDYCRRDNFCRPIEGERSGEAGSNRRLELRWSTLWCVLGKQQRGPDGHSFEPRY